MRKIEKKMVEAVRNERAFKSGNTIVIPSEFTGTMRVYLHNNCIADICNGIEPNTKRITLNSCGWRTATTKSRLNALLGGLCFNAGVYQQNGEWYLHHGGGVCTFRDNMSITEGV